MLFLKALVLLVVIPLIGFGVSKWVLYDINTELAKENAQLTVQHMCTPEILSQIPELQPLCDEVRPILWMQDWSIISGIVAILLLFSFVFFGGIAGKNRTRIAIIFPPLVFFSLLVLSGLVLVQGIILTYASYLAESTAIQRVHFVLIGAVGIGAFLGAWSLIKSSFKLALKQKHSMVGFTLLESSHPKIFAFTQDIAQSMGATAPDNIVVGLEPNFYVTSADVKVIGEGNTLKGETLFLSLPLARIFTIEEMKAVIGHELGHFRGKDTYYSRKFSPVYSGLIHAVDAMENGETEGDALDIAKVPAVVLLSYMIDVFHRNVSSIGRVRELEADKAAVEVAPPTALATSLVKISLYAHAWNELQEALIARLGQGKMTRNLSKLFASAVKYDIKSEEFSDVLSDIAEENISHPTDSHPPTGVRIQNLGVAIESFDNSLLLTPEESSVHLIENYKELEEKLTAFQQHYYVALGVQVPDEEEVNDRAVILAALGAHMVLADEKIEQEEIDNAEAAGIALNEDFDRIDFREYCHYPEMLPSVEDLLAAVTEVPSEWKKGIYEYLKEIAGADQEISLEEQKLLDRLAPNLLQAI